VCVCVSERERESSGVVVYSVHTPTRWVERGGGMIGGVETFVFLETFNRILMITIHCNYKNH
jgi:hypothetical protein